MMQESRDKEAWKARWTEGRTTWDQGAEHPELARLIQKAQSDFRLLGESHIYSGGCGRAHNEAFLAGLGFHVKAVDLVGEAIVEAQKLYGKRPRLELLQGDVLTILPEEREAFAGVFDRAMLCALPPPARSAYVDTQWARLREGGLFMSILFRKVNKTEGPPFAIDEKSAFELLAPKFHLTWAGAGIVSPSGGTILDEWLCIWSKKKEESRDERKDP